MTEYLQYGAFGLLCLVLTACGWAIRYAITEVWRPSVEERSQIARQLAEDQKRCLEGISAGVQCMAETSRQICERQGEQGKTLDHHGMVLEKHGNHLQELLKRTEGL